MRIMMKVSMPVEAGNRAAKTNELGQTIQAILAEQKPEAVYFGTQNGQRTAFLFVHIKEGSELAAPQWDAPSSRRGGGGRLPCNHW